MSLPFDVPTLQLPTAIFSFSFGITKLLILVGKAIKMIIDKVNGVVPEQGVVEQTDENAAVQGSGEMVIKGNGTEMVKEKVEEKIKEEAQAKLDEKLEQKLTRKLTQQELEDGPSTTAII